ncbi:MAG TPA: hypothetical protein DCY89_02265 [Gammaproteobacteria bacterium]|nr:hypothetical protein [Gammaproteobacteria bacterium]
MKIFTIGFTKKTAERFFGLLARSGTQRIIDVRIHNVSQLAGFAKRDDLAYFARSICSVGYLHLPELAPEPGMLDDYKNKHRDWALYERQFLDLMQLRRIEDRISPDIIDGGCLLCSEDKPHHCHRRLVAEYLQKCWAGRSIEISHLV